MKSEKPRKVHFDLPQDEGGYPPATSEFLWCTPTSQGTYMVDNVPFFIRNIALGDEIRANKTSRVLKFTGIVSPSRNSTLRVMLMKSTVLGRVQEKLDGFGCGYELLQRLKLLAVTVPPEADAKRLLQFLDQEAETGNIGIEESAPRYALKE